MAPGQPYYPPLQDRYPYPPSSSSYIPPPPASSSSYIPHPPPAFAYPYHQHPHPYPYPQQPFYPYAPQPSVYRGPTELTYVLLENDPVTRALVPVTYPTDMANDLSVLWAEIANLTVDRLKNSIIAINDQMGNNLKRSGNKPELIERLQVESRNLYGDQHDKSRYNQFRAIIRNSHPSAAYHPPAPPPPAPHHYPAPAYQPAHAHGLPPPRFAPGGGYAQYAAPAAGAAQPGGTIKFKSSPFYRVEKAVGQITTLVRAGQGDRKMSIFSFILGADQCTLLQQSKASSSNPQYQVRLFSTSEDYYNIARPHDNAASLGAPVDFPATCEIKLNQTPVTANTKGIKKQVGTAPPVDLSRVGNGTSLNLGLGQVNKVEIVYVNTEKKYFVAAALVEVTSVKQVVEKIKKAKYRTKEDVVASIIKQNSDPDVVATAYGLSLKDPLVGSRIKTPIRSLQCSHIGCFDAEVFFMMNEQTPAWACPICSKTLRVEDITVDGYFDNILNMTTSSTESVTVEPDGTWRAAASETAPPSRSNSAALPTANQKGKQRASEALTIDSDDDDDDDSPPPRALASGSAHMNPGVKRPASDEVARDAEAARKRARVSDEGQQLPTPTGYEWDR
ncbi:hypothetical protein RQP46_011471 [Phenoliferia psychrophenolica]